MPSVLSNFFGNAALAALQTGHFLALHESAPDVTGTPANEVGGGGYTRQPILMSPPSGKTTVSTNAQVFPGMPAVTVTDLAIWTALAGGNLCVIIHLTTPIVVLASGQVLCAAGDVAVSV